MSDKNIIEKLKIEKQKWVDEIYGVGETRIDLMIDDVISELETYKKIAEKLAEELSKHIWLNDKDAILKIYREKVEEDEN